jgi:sugar/nucleoside kinase (ribokinase family)
MKKILGIGNALVDIMIPLENDGILEILNLPKGSMQLVDMKRSNSILEALKTHKRSFSAGGSTANTIHGLAKLSVPTGYIGVIGEDELGGFFVQDMINAGVEPHMIHSTQETGRAIALVTPDSERTFATYLGAAVELSAEHLISSSKIVIASEAKQQHPASSIFKRYDYFHIEGYLVQNHELMVTAVKLAKENKLTVSIDLPSYNMVEANQEFLWDLIRNYVDIVFANEDEAKAISGKETMEALNEISNICDIAIVKTGKKGSLIKSGKEIIPIGIIPVSLLDTTGAGDLYASGFLYALSTGKPLQKCGETGALLAGNVIEVMGSKMPEERWIRIFGEL